MNPDAISISLSIIAFLALISYIKEKLENSRLTPPTQNNPSIEKAEVSFKAPESAVEATE